MKDGERAHSENNDAAEAERTKRDCLLPSRLIQPGPQRSKKSLKA